MSKITDQVKESKLYKEITATMSKEQVVMYEDVIFSLLKIYDSEVLEKLKKTET